MKRAIVCGLALVAAAVILLSDSTASAREKGGRRARKSGGEQQTYSSYSQPTRVVYQMVPTESQWIPVPPSNMGYTPPRTYANYGVKPIPASYPANPSYPTNVPTLATPREATMTITPTSPEHTAELVEIIQALRAAGYVK